MRMTRSGQILQPFLLFSTAEKFHKLLNYYILLLNYYILIRFNNRALVLSSASGESKISNSNWANHQYKQFFHFHRSKIVYFLFSDVQQIMKRVRFFSRILRDPSIRNHSYESLLMSQYHKTPLTWLIV